MWFIGVEIEQETSAAPPKKNPESTPGQVSELCIRWAISQSCLKHTYQTGQL